MGQNDVIDSKGGGGGDNHTVQGRTNQGRGRRWKLPCQILVKLAGGGGILVFICVKFRTIQPHLPV